MKKWRYIHLKHFIVWFPRSYKLNVQVKHWTLLRANQASEGLNHSSSCKVHQPWATSWDLFCRMDESKAKIKDPNQDQAVDVHSAHSANYHNKGLYANLVCSKCQFFGLHNQHMDFRHILLNKRGNWITTSQNALGLPENSHSTTIMLLFEIKRVKDKKKSTD